MHVVDTGKGIKESEMERLFSMFGKLLRTADMNSEGIGMGLMICKNLVELNGGEISVHSDGEDRGAMFTFTMKMSEAAENEKPSNPTDFEGVDAMDVTNLSAVVDHDPLNITSRKLLESEKKQRPMSVDKKRVTFGPNQTHFFEKGSNFESIEETKRDTLSEASSSLVAEGA